MTTNRDMVGNAMDALKSGLVPFVSREFINRYGRQSTYKLQEILDERIYDIKDLFNMDVAVLLNIMWRSWNDVYRNTLGYAERRLVSELQDIHNRWAHHSEFSSDDTYRVLDSAHRLLLAVSALESSKIEDMKIQLLRRRYDEHTRIRQRKTSSMLVEGQGADNLVPWREVINPHDDVASGQYQQAEFAADLYQVHLGKGSTEYTDPVEFFRRTYLTDSLKHLLSGAIQRLTSMGGDPVVQIQTNFGGGKTHSMLALYHLFSGIKIEQMSGMDAVIQDGSVSYSANRVVLVGSRISPGNPTTKTNGPTIRTLWGELAWQLGNGAGGIAEARRAYERIRADDENATNPGDVLRELLQKYGPSLILIDEWVAYARQLHDEGDLPAGSFETQFTFAQALSESAKMVKDCLVVISLPASDYAESPTAQTDDIEVGGARGRAALNRLRNVIGRVESSWRPASAEESFEIVRRRLFQPISETNFAARDNVARAFHVLYNTNKQVFPVECAEADYEKRIIAAYPIHPEVFERLYTDWSTLQNFQRTRGVLRLMASVIHSLWEKGDRNPLILPAHIPLDDSRVQTELIRHLSENWVPVIESDVDGANSLPRRLDNEISNLGKYSACRRVARSIYLGSAPILAAANRGIENRRINLGCIIPGESPAVFNDAVRRLGSTATYLYQDGARYWYSTQPTVSKLAENRAEVNRQDRDKINQEIRRRLQENLKDRGDFDRIHLFPSSSQDVRDDRNAGLVVLAPSSSYEKGSNNLAIAAARNILESRGNSRRLFINTLAFLAADNTRLQDLEEGIGQYLAWQSILDDREELDLPPHQVKQAQSQLNVADGTVSERIGETYRWLLIPIQQTPQSNIEWRYIQLSGHDHLARLASEKMVKDEMLVTCLAGTRLRMEIDRIPLWRGDHVSVQQLVDDFARYSYLPMLKEPSVLLEAIRGGLSMTTWEKDSFAYADSYDDIAKRYRGLQTRLHRTLMDSDTGLLVRPEVARRQMDAETASVDPTGEKDDKHEPEIITHDPVKEKPSDLPEQNPAKRYHGSVVLDPTRVGLAASQIADEVVVHLTSLLGADVKITLHIEAKIPSGVPKHTERTIIENSRSLTFDDSGFESE